MTNFDCEAFKRQQQLIGKMNASIPGTISYEVKMEMQGKPPFICKFCGAPSWVDPADQSPPADYCHESDHGSREDYEDD